MCVHPLLFNNKNLQSGQRSDLPSRHKMDCTINTKISFASWVCLTHAMN